MLPDHCGVSFVLPEGLCGDHPGPRRLKRMNIMVKRIVLAVVLTVVSVGTAYAGYRNCQTTCYWAGNRQICNTQCY
jgi:hypothetical protein